MIRLVTDFLEAMIRSSSQRAASAKRRVSEAVLRIRALDAPQPPPLVLHPQGFDVFAEIKRRAPSTGSLIGASGSDDQFVARQASVYARGGAAAISVLTEPEAFAGSLLDLSEAARAVPVPVMRKDFLVDPYQVLEARAAGAAGVLLIARLLDDALLLEMVDAAKEMQLFVLIEAFDEDDLARAGKAASGCARLGIEGLVGLNTRDLSNLAVSRARLHRLRNGFLPDARRVAESGLSSEKDAREVAALGYDVALVGSALMRAKDATALLTQMIAAGRAARSGTCASA
jgi:indole-3-glycerol phosphate synthase